MKKLFFAMVALFMNATVSFGQDVQMATLQHGDNMNAYYGADAFKSAMEAAESGDLISLSAGSFNATDITKAVKIQGAGYVQNVANNRFRTSINGDFWINIPEGQTGLYIEGIYMNGDNIYVIGVLDQFTFTKCRTKGFQFSNGSPRGLGVNCLFSQCRIGTLSLDNSPSIYIKNCIIGTLSSNADMTPTVEHSIIMQKVDNNIAGTFTNSFIAYPSSNTKCVYYHNVTLSCNTKYTKNYINTSTEEGNIQYNSESEDSKNAYYGIFVDYKSNDIDAYSCHLNDEQASEQLSNDGTQIGIYGGETPFTDVPSNPQITSKQIAKQSDANGKLSVKITVEAQ